MVAPGSSIKPFTLLELLQSGKVAAQTALLCKRFVSIDGHKLDCSHPKTDQPLDPAEALAYSCNSYFTEVALRLTPTELQSSLVRDGFASLTGLTSDEVSGSVSLASVGSASAIAGHRRMGYSGDAARDGKGVSYARLVEYNP